MRGFLKNIVYKVKQISIIILFIVTAGLVTFLLPREAKFKYEYNRGNPWLHDDLTAPFQFSIYKTDAKLQAERDTILKDLNYYFHYSSDVGPEMLVKFRNEFEKNWVYYTLKEYRISSEESYTKHNRYFALRKLQADYFGLLYDLLKEVYDKGIMEYPDYETTFMTDDSDAVLVKGIDAEHTKISSFFTAKL
ncbi:MAG: hypothetical protein MI922_19485, partial [Bacteroidales bacterium]|nr:hypothetical protein [Bacteroidales bacterium]